MLTNGFTWLDHTLCFAASAIFMFVCTNCAVCCLIHSNDSWLLKVEHGVGLDRNVMGVIRWACGFTLKERMKNAELRELLGLLGSVSLVIKKCRLR